MNNNLKTFKNTFSSNSLIFSVKNWLYHIAKILSDKKKIRTVVLILIFLYGISGCATIKPIHEPVEKKPLQDKTEDVGKNQDNINSRAIASLNLTTHGQMLLENGRIDESISIFERSISINPKNGKNYYYLAEAWYKKGNMRLSKEFNRLAGIYMDNNFFWINLVKKQKKKIAEKK